MQMWTVCLIIVLCMVLVSLCSYAPHAHIRSDCNQSASRQCGCNRPCGKQHFREIPTPDFVSKCTNPTYHLV
jgi:hypothetical protein